ncbi:MAG: ribonucleoside-triphosphate reductase, adenosylcobalamin-dependent [Clostridium sp.]
MKNYLGTEFIKRMDELTPPFTNLGEFVRLRTYSRFINELGRRETWKETLTRVVNNSLEILEKHNPLISQNELVKEAEFMYESIFMLKTFPSGRSLWVAGTHSGENSPLSNFNCSFTTIESFDDYKEIFTLCMLGSGTGIRIKKIDVDNLPSLRTHVGIHHRTYKPLHKALRKEYTEVTFEEDIAVIHIGDSKQGWAESISIYFKLLSDYIYTNINTIVLEYDSVRPKGEVLKSFGGRASGHESMKKMYTKIHELICGLSNNGKVETIDALDIANIIGENVVSGGVRRTAQIILFDIEDNKAMLAKSELYTQDNEGEWVTNEKVSHRRMSNNSVFFEEKPSRTKLHEIIEMIRYTGEPGFINAEAARKRRDNFNGVNPCGEILLDKKSVCNLTTTNMMAFVDSENCSLNLEELKETIKLSVRIGLRMTLLHLEIASWDKTHQRDRLLGVSFTGFQDMSNILGLKLKDQAKLLKTLKTVAREEADRYADELCVNRPLLVTTIKPEGTISTLPSVSSGVHFSHSPYYIRRVRVSSTDPIIKVIEELEYPVYPEVGQQLETCDTKIVEFPMKSPMGKTKYDVSAIEQLEIYKMTMENWTDHNTSITVHVRDNEWEAVEEWVWKNWDTVVGISFLSLNDNFYPMLPYEAIDEEEYNSRINAMKAFDETLLYKYENSSEEYDLKDDACAGGVCPTR